MALKMYIVAGVAILAYPTEYQHQQIVEYGVANTAVEAEAHTLSNLRTNFLVRDGYDVYAHAREISPAELFRFTRKVAAGG